MARGRALEKSVISVVAKNLNVKVNSCGAIIDPRYPVVIGSPDGVGDGFVMEVKCPTCEKVISNYLTKEDRPKDKYYAQIQLQMFLYKCRKGYFCVADPKFEQNNKVTVILVKYSEVYVKSLIDKSVSFWKINIFPKLLQSAACCLIDK